MLHHHHSGKKKSKTSLKFTEKGFLVKKKKKIPVTTKNIQGPKHQKEMSSESDKGYNFSTVLK